MSDGAKGRKFGRGSRSPSMKTYNAVNRAAVNKKRRIAKHIKAVLEAKEKHLTMVPRGTARKTRRANVVIHTNAGQKYAEKVAGLQKRV